MSVQGQEAFPQGEDLPLAEQFDLGLDDGTDVAPDMGDPGAAEY